MIKQYRVKIANMHCSNCALAITKHFEKIDNIKATILLSDNEGIFEYDDQIISTKFIDKELKNIGYPKVKESQTYIDLIKLGVSIVLTIPFIVWMIQMMKGTMHNHYGWIQFILASIVILVSGLNYIKGCIRDFKNRRLGMDVLVTIGTMTAYIYSFVLLITKSSNTLYFETTAMLLTVISVGKYIEKLTKVKSSSSLKELISLKQVNAKVLEDEGIIVTNIKDITIGQILILSAGEAIPLDCKVLEGSCIVDESMISGESSPVLKQVGDILYQGAIIASGSSKTVVLSDDSNSYLSKMIRKVEEIQSSKPKIQKTADKIASIFVPTILSLSFITFLVNIALIHNELSISINRAISVLVISCPCALGLATPLAILVGSSLAIKHGIIINNSDMFEKANKIDMVCFDKTGTLTTGMFVIDTIETNSSKYLDVIYTLESISNHPIAKSLVKQLKEKDVKIIKTLKPKEIIGKGIEADNYFLYKENDEVILKENDIVCAKIKVKEQIKDNAAKLISVLKEKNIESALITGDNKEKAQEIANIINVKNVNYNILPENKQIIVKSYQSNHKICFVGDGINDTLAMNSSDMSIAMGSGTDVAKSSSDVTISNDNLMSIYNTIVLSRKVYKTINYNFMWALAYNVIAIPLAMFGILNPVISGTCMAFSNIIVVLNSLSIRKVKLK